MNPIFEKFLYILLCIPISFFSGLFLTGLIKIGKTELSDLTSILMFIFGVFLSIDVEIGLISEVKECGCLPPFVFAICTGLVYRFFKD